MTEMRTDLGHEGPRPVVILTDGGMCRVGYSGRNFVEVPHCSQDIFAALLRREGDSPGILAKTPLYLGDISEDTRREVEVLTRRYNSFLNPTLDLLTGED